MTVYLGRGGERRELRLGKLLGEGAAGKVHALPAMPGVAGKLYHDGAARKHEAKIDAMIANPPDLPPAIHERVHYPQIAWPQAKLFDAAGRFVGFTMPEIDFGRSTSLVNLLQKNSRRIEKLSDYYGYRVLVARNLASVFAELHRAGHHMIDMKPANLRFYPVVSWMAVVDTDGFSIAGRNGRIAADQLSDEYIAPESWKCAADTLGVAQDEFALAVIIFQLLNNGVHPFAGGATGGPVQPTDLQARILEGLYPYAMQPRAGVAPSAASVHRMLRRGTRAMFDCAFVAGGRRPSAEEWRDHLDSLLGHLVPCSAKPDEHVHFGAGCGFCAHEARIAAARATPSVRRRPAPRPPAAAQLPPSFRSTPYPMPPRSVARSAAPARRSGPGWGVMLAVLMLAIGAFASLDLWQPLLSSSSARAADLVATPSAPTKAELAAFAEPVDYLVVPTGGSLSVPLRGGPGVDYAVIDQLALHDAVLGQGFVRDSRGRRWIWVSRLSDGQNGYVAQSALLKRSAATDIAAGSAVAPDCAGADPCEGNSRLEVRYRRLLANAEGYDRAYLTEGQQLWMEQRQRCDVDAAPAACRRTADARRMGDLRGWSEAERLTKQDRLKMPRVTPASLTELN